MMPKKREPWSIECTEPLIVVVAMVCVTAAFVAHTIWGSSPCPGL